MVAINEPCSIRRRAVKALGDAGLVPRVVVQSAYLAGVVEAARAGRGVALLASWGDPPEGLVPVHALPAVAPASLRIARNRSTPVPLVDTVRATVTEAVGGGSGM